MGATTQGLPGDIGCGDGSCPLEPETARSEPSGSFRVSDALAASLAKSYVTTPSQ